MLVCCFLSQRNAKKVISQALAMKGWVDAMARRTTFNSSYKCMGLIRRVYVKQTPGFEDPAHPNKVYRVVQGALWSSSRPLTSMVYVDDIIFGSTKSSMVKDFEELMQKEFKMSSMGELTFFLGLQRQAIQLWSMDWSALIVLTASRPAIMFAVCCVHTFQVTPSGTAASLGYCSFTREVRRLKKQNPSKLNRSQDSGHSSRNCPKIRYSHSKWSRIIAFEKRNETEVIEEKSDETEKSIWEEEASNVKKWRYEETGFWSLLQDTATSSTITPWTLNFEVKQVLQAHSVQFKLWSLKNNLKLLKFYFCWLLSNPNRPRDTCFEEPKRTKLSSYNKSRAWKLDNDEEVQNDSKLNGMRRRGKKDLYHLYRVVQDYYEHIPPTGLGLILLGDLTTIWETPETSGDDFWKNQEDWEIVKRGVLMNLQSAYNYEIRAMVDDENETGHYLDTSVHFCGQL
ncbi:putative ribonuclease H-like domain-containing protein [Tanacetum coccineum]